MSEGTKKRRIYSDVFLLNYIPLFRTRMAAKGDEWGNWICGKGRKRECLKRKFRGKESTSDFAFAFLAFRPFIVAASGDTHGVFRFLTCCISAFGIGQIGADGILRYFEEFGNIGNIQAKIVQIGDLLRTLRRKNTVGDENALDRLRGHVKDTGGLGHILGDLVVLQNFLLDPNLLLDFLCGI